MANRRMAAGRARAARRRFLKGLAGGVAAPYVAAGSVFGAGGRPAPSDRITMGFVGVGDQGSRDMAGFLRFPQVQAVAVCDVDARRRLAARQRVEGHYAQPRAAGTYRGCAEYVDFREVCARSDVDAVFCGTPDHWHAPVTIHAMRCGKDVYCEKPESLTFREGQVQVETARRYGRVFSGGSQRVWGDFARYHQAIWAGAIGQVEEIWVNLGGTSGERTFPAEPVPPWLDWDQWVGPAPWRPYNQAMARNIAGWEYVRDFGGGGITGWGAHYVGAALFAARMHEGPLPVEVVPDAEDDRPTRRRDAGDGRFQPWRPAGTTLRSGLTWKYANGLRMHLGGAWGGAVSFKGALGRMPDPATDRVAARPVDIQNYRGGRGIQGDFLHCVKTRQRPFRDIAIANRAIAACHLANIVLWTGRALKFDPVKEQIVGDDEASRWLQRACREPWRV